MSAFNIYKLKKQKNPIKNNRSNQTKKPKILFLGTNKQNCSARKQHNCQFDQNFNSNCRSVNTDFGIYPEVLSLCSSLLKGKHLHCNCRVLNNFQWKRRVKYCDLLKSFSDFLESCFAIELIFCVNTALYEEGTAPQVVYQNSVSSVM